MSKQDVHCVYGEMQRYASEMEAKLPGLITSEDWCEIDKITKIPKDVWSGKSADYYESWRKDAVARKNVDYVMAFPQVIRESSDIMRQKERAMVQNAQQ